MPYDTIGARTRKRKRSLDIPTQATEPLGKGFELPSSKKGKTESSGDLTSTPKEWNQQNSLHSKRFASSSSRCSQHILRSITREQATQMLDSN